MRLIQADLLSLSFLSPVDLLFFLFDAFDYFQCCPVAWAIYGNASQCSRFFHRDLLDFRTLSLIFVNRWLHGVHRYS